MSDKQETTPVGPPSAPAHATAARDHVTDAASTAAADQTPVRKSFITFLTLGVFGVYLAFVTPIAISLAIRVNALEPNHPEYLGLVLSLGSVAGLITGPLGGVLSDRTRSRFGRRRPWLFGSTAVGMVGLLIMAASPSVVGLAVGWIIAAAALNLAANTFLTVQADRVPEIQRGRVAALTGFATMVAPVVGAVVGGIAATQPFIMFLAPGAAALLFVLIFAVFYKEPSTTEVTFDDKLSLRSIASKYIFSPKRFPDYGWNWLGRFLFFFALTLSTSYTAFFFAARLAVPVEEVGGIVATVGGAGILATIAGVFLGGFLSDKLRRRKPFVLGAGVVFGLGALVTVSAPDLALLIVGTAIGNLAIGVYSAVDQALVLDVLPERDTEAARYVNIMALANGIPQAAAPLVASALLTIGVAGGGERPYWLLYVAAAVFAVAAGFVVLKVKSVR